MEVIYILIFTVPLSHYLLAIYCIFYQFCHLFIKLNEYCYLDNIDIDRHHII